MIEKLSFWNFFVVFCMKGHSYISEQAKSLWCSALIAHPKTLSKEGYLHMSERIHKKTPKGNFSYIMFFTVFWPLAWPKNAKRKKKT